MYNFNEADKKVIRGIRAVVKERGADWTYPPRKEENRDWYANGNLTSGQCVNLLPNGDAACIVGAIACDQDMYIQGRTGVTSFADTHGLSNPVAWAVAHAQGAQDRFKSWGLALDGFEAELKIVGVVI